MSGGWAVRGPFLRGHEITTRRIGFCRANEQKLLIEVERYPFSNGRTINLLL